MDKDGGSSRLSTHMRRTGGDRDVFLDKSSKKEKLRLSCMGLLGEMDQFSHSITTNSTSKRVKVSKKFYDHHGVINHASAPPRKLRSAMKKQENEMGGFAIKKHKRPVDSNQSLQDNEFKDSKTSSVITKEEEEVAAALFALAQTGPNISPQVQVEPPPLVQQTMPPKSRNRCSVHVYICTFIKLLQTKIDQRSKQGACVTVNSDTNPQKITNDYGKGRAFDMEAGHASSSNVANRPKTTNFSGPLSTAAVQQVLPYFDTMERDLSQWSTKIQQSWGNQLTSKASYQNWQNQRHNRTAPLSVEIFGSQGSLLQLLGSGHASNTEQQRQCISQLASDKRKMQLSDCPSGYDDKGGLYFVDSGPTLKLTL